MHSKLKTSPAVSQINNIMLILDVHLTSNALQLLTSSIVAVWIFAILTLDLICSSVLFCLELGFFGAIEISSLRSRLINFRLSTDEHQFFIAACRMISSRGVHPTGLVLLLFILMDHKNGKFIYFMNNRPIGMQLL